MYYNKGNSKSKRKDGNICTNSPCNVSSTKNEVQITGLDPDSVYYVRVSAMNGVLEGPKSDPVRVEGNTVAIEPHV